MKTFSKADLLIDGLSNPRVLRLPLAAVGALVLIELAGGALAGRTATSQAAPPSATPGATTTPGPAAPAPVLPQPAQPSPSPSPPVARPPAIPPEHPRVVVFATGGAPAAETIERVLADTLRGSGLQVVGSLRLESLRQRAGSGADPLEVLTAVQQGGGAEVLVFARVAVLEQRQVLVYGQADTLTRSSLRVDAFAVVDESGLGSWSEELQSGQRFAQEETERGAATLASGVAAGVQQGWADYRRRFTH